MIGSILRNDEFIKGICLKWEKLKMQNDFKNDIIFVNPAGITGFPTGIGQLALSLIESRCKVGLVDATSSDLTPTEVVNRIITSNCRIVGLGGWWEHYAFIKEVSIKLKEAKPSILQIAGGEWVSPIPEFIIKNFPIDVVVRGEADNSIVELVHKILDNLDLTEVKGISFQKDNKVYHTPNADIIHNLDEIPFPHYDMFDMDYYTTFLSLPVDFFTDYAVSRKEIRRRFGNKKVLKRFYAYSTRGCYGKCSFCSAAKRPMRKYSPEYVVENLKLLHEKYGIDIFFFGDSLTLTSKKWVKDLCRKIIDERLNIMFLAVSRADFPLDDETALLLKEAGCFVVAVGFESGNQQMLNSMGKKIQLEKYYRTVDMFQKHGIEIRGSFVLNLPGETEESIEDTIEFVKKTNLNSFSVNYASPLPGTDLFKYAVDKGFIKDIEQLLEKDPGRHKGLSDFDSYYSHFNFNGIPKEKLISARERLLEIGRIAHNKKYTRGPRKMILKSAIRWVVGALMRKKSLAGCER